MHPRRIDPARLQPASPPIGLTLEESAQDDSEDSQLQRCNSQCRCSYAELHRRRQQPWFTGLCCSHAKDRGSGPHLQRPVPVTSLPKSITGNRQQPTDGSSRDHSKSYQQRCQYRTAALTCSRLSCGAAKASPASVRSKQRSRSRRVRPVRVAVSPHSPSSPSPCRQRSDRSCGAQQNEANYIIDKLEVDDAFGRQVAREGSAATGPAARIQNHVN